MDGILETALLWLIKLWCVGPPEPLALFPEPKNACFSKKLLELFLIEDVGGALLDDPAPSLLEAVPDETDCDFISKPKLSCVSLLI